MAIECRYSSPSSDHREVPLENVTQACFGLSYLLAFGLELAVLLRPGKALRLAGLLAGAAGLSAHTIYLGLHAPNLAAPGASLLAVAWVLAVFTWYGTLHHGKRAWGVYGWPFVLVVTAFARVAASGESSPALLQAPAWLTAERFWGGFHGLLVLGAAVGAGVGCLASVMYLVQADRLRRKVAPLGGAKHLSLERLEQMNRRAVNFAFPLLTVGLLLGVFLLRQGHDVLDHWWNLKVLGTVGLWLVFLVLLYLRYGSRVSGRRLAGLTIAAFALMLLTLAAAHPFAEGGSR